MDVTCSFNGLTKEGTRSETDKIEVSSFTGDPFLIEKIKLRVEDSENLVEIIVKCKDLINAINKCIVD